MNDPSEGGAARPPTRLLAFDGREAETMMMHEEEDGAEEPSASGLIARAKEQPVATATLVASTIAGVAISCVVLGDD
ncbi:MAG: hypothetical protein JRH16_12830 [Deltaproteobacteria bacterium]|nr:hypothetical protein [Deltaproteobacteria bacterium]MBW2361005.1 hypothetical protein [Deltaproteobacteria bacterium]